MSISTDSASRTAADWDALFERFVAASPPLTQRAFCEQHGVSFDAFRNRYRKSPTFAGKRRRSPGRTAIAGDTGPAFRPVSTARSAPLAPPRSPTGPATMVVRVHEHIGVECLAGADPVIVAALVRELVR